MAGITPFFVNGANAKIRVNNRVLAFCTDLSYSIVVNHAAPKILGMYEATTVEPLSYDITGSFTVIRYTAGAGSDDSHGKQPSGVSKLGNGIGTLGPQDTITNTIGGGGDDGKANQSFNPKFFANSIMFDIEVWQKMACGELSAVARIRNCRLTRSDFKLIKRGVATQTFQFTATYVDEDSFVADMSGVGQQLGH